MAFRTWGKVLLAALGVGVVSGAGQLGIAYGLGLVRFNRTFDAVTANQWPAQRVWVGWFAMVAAVTGALIADRLARRYDLPTTPGVQAATAAAAALGALVVAPLSMQPARTAQVASADPVVSVGVIAALGAGIGFVAALAVLVQRPIRWNVGAVVAAVWFLAVLSVMPSLGPDDPLPAVRLGVLDPSWLGAGTAQRLAVVTMPALALVIGALAGALARSRGLPMPAVASCGVAGPALLALAYLVAGPGNSSDGYQAAPYWGALIAVAAGGLGSVLAAMARWPLTTAGTPEPGEPTPTVDTTSPATTTATGVTIDEPSPATTWQFRPIADDATEPGDNPGTAHGQLGDSDTRSFGTVADIPAPRLSTEQQPVVSDQPVGSDHSAATDRISDIQWPLADRYGPVGGFGSATGRADFGTPHAEPGKPQDEPATRPDNPVTGAAGLGGSPAGGSAPAEFSTGWSGVRRLRTEDFWPTESPADKAPPTETTPRAEATTRAAAAPAEATPPAAPPPVVPGRAVPPPVIPGPATPPPVIPGPAAPPPVARPAATPSPITTPPTAPPPVTARGTAPSPVSGRSTAPPPVGGSDAGSPGRDGRVNDEPSDEASTVSPAATARPRGDEQSIPSVPTRTDDSWDAFAPSSRPRSDRDTTPTWSFHQSIELGDDQAPISTYRAPATRADAERPNGAPASPSHATLPEPGRTEPGRTETGRTETGRRETDRIDPGQTDSGQTDSGHAHRGGSDGFGADATRTDLEAAEGSRPEATSDQDTTPAGTGDPVTSTGRIRRGLFRRNRSGAQSAPEQSRATDTGPAEPKQREPKQREPKGRNRTDEPVPARDEEYVEWVSGLSEPDPATDDLSRESGVRRSLRSTGRHHAD
ncbi:hypothetical protein ACFP2T_25845 [Plantactinospora solaniradicis]|uniref:MFS transporter n=1 Tax=Plantactinospora solaniradicis TaxID=1723736 RepID=A0ABW1KDI2_9ACTN